MSKNTRNTEKLVPLKASSVKRAVDNAALQMCREVTFSDCPKCGQHTLGKLGNVEVCLNCDDL